MNLAIQKSSAGNSQGQSLVEAALILPLLLLLVCNVVNLGYFFLIVVNLTGASRSSTLYSIEGSYSPYALQEPASGTSTGSKLATTPGTVSYAALQDMTGAVWNPTGTIGSGSVVTSIQVCTQMNVNNGSGVNGSGSSLVANCDTCDTSNGCSLTNSNGVLSPALKADPEAPNFILNEVDIQYTFSTLIPGTIFNLPLQASPFCNGGTCTFTRKARMRSMGP
jgi:Flp pilus assembly protein TadG